MTPANMLERFIPKYILTPISYSNKTLIKINTFYAKLSQTKFYIKYVCLKNKIYETCV